MAVCWCPPVLIEPNIALFPISYRYQLAINNIPQWIHHFNVKTKTLTARWIQYPSRKNTKFIPNERYCFSYDSEKNEIIVLSPEGDIYAINIQTKQWKMFPQRFSLPHRYALESVRILSTMMMNDELQCIAVKYKFDEKYFDLGSVTHLKFDEQDKKFVSV